MDIEALAQRARENISDFCINECKAFCCKKGHLMVNKNEFQAMLGKKDPSKLPPKSIMKDGLGNILLDLTKMEKCPSLKNNLCTIHKDQNRSKTCKEFPIFIYGKEVHIHQRCLAAFEGKLYPFTYQAMQMGYKIIDNN